MTIKMNYFDYDLFETYYTKSLVNSDCWIFLSHGNEVRKPLSDNADKVATTFLEKTIGAIRLYPEDFAFMIPIRFWQQSQVYTEYDDTINISNLPYFVSVEPEIESGSYHVFKCISNNYGAASLEKPTFNQNIVSGIYEGGDGYIWKYMTSIPYIEYRKFTAKRFMPVFRNKLVEQISNTGIYNIKVENRNANFRYELFGGEVKSVDVIGKRIIISSIRRLSGSDKKLSSVQSLDFQIEDFYADRIFRIDSSTTNNLIGTRSYKIFGSGVDANSERFVTLNSVEGISNGDSFEITPEVIIKGDGAGAIGIPIFEQERITSIRMLSYGNNYKNATAYISKPKLGFSSDQGAVEAILRPIVSPVGGHGSNVVRELVSKSISVAALVTSGQSSELPSNGTYSKIGLVKSPSFKQSAVFTTRNTTVVQERVNEIYLENVTGILPGMSVKFGNSIPSKTIVTNISVNDNGNVVFLSADVEIRIPQNSSIEFSSVLGTFDNRIRIIAETIPGELKAGEVVTQPRPEGDVTAIIHSVDFQTNEIYLMQYTGDFSDTFVIDQPIITRLGSIGINTIEYSPYEQKTGEVLYVSDVTPIIREADRVEQLRVILQF